MNKSRTAASITIAEWEALPLREAVTLLSAGRAAWLWLLVEPLVQVAFLLFIYTGFRMHYVGGVNTGIWLMVGMMTFLMFRRTSTRAQNAIDANKGGGGADRALWHQRRRSLRRDEANMVLQWVERAKQTEPSGQVLIAQNADRKELPLENGDVLRVPLKDGLVLVSGEVLFPNTIAYDKSLDVADYFRRSGGYTQIADVDRVIVAHRDGSFEDLSEGGFLSSGPKVRPGDEVLVLPRVDMKSRQFWKEMTQIIYQIAVSAKVISTFK